MAFLESFLGIIAEVGWDIVRMLGSIRLFPRVLCWLGSLATTGILVE
jgi:hypothetical protein